MCKEADQGSDRRLAVAASWMSSRLLEAGAIVQLPNRAPVLQEGAERSRPEGAAE